MTKTMKRTGLLAIALLGLGACATNGQGDRRGAVIAGWNARQVVQGPGMLHAYVEDQGAHLYLAHTVTGGDADCQAAVAQASAAPVVPVERRVTLMVFPGETVCLVGARRNLELLWHLHPIGTPTTSMLATAPR
jgi:hypothetical protein